MVAASVIVTRMKGDGHYTVGSTGPVARQQQQQQQHTTASQPILPLRTAEDRFRSGLLNFQLILLVNDMLALYSKYMIVLYGNFIAFYSLLFFFQSSHPRL